MSNYTTVQHIPRIKLGITMNEYAIANSIYHLSNNYKGNGWCSSSKEYFAKYFGLSKRSIHTIINKLTDAGLIEKAEFKSDKGATQYKTTQLWYDEVVGFSNEESSHETVKKVHTHSEESSHNNNINNNIDNKKILKKKEREEKALEVLDYACREMLITGNRSKWKYKATSLERIEHWLKEYTDKQLKKSIDNYISTVEDKKYITIPKNFFSTSKRGKEYAPFRNFLDEMFDKVEQKDYDWGEY